MLDLDHVSILRVRRMWLASQRHKRMQEWMDGDMDRAMRGG